MRGIRWFPAIVGGLLAGLAIYMVGSMIATTPQMWLLFAGWIGIGIWAGKAGPAAWGRVWLVLAICSFAMPLASLLGGASITAQQVGSTTDAASQAGAVIGGAIGTTMLAGLTGFVGFFLGIIFALLAYFSFRSARQARATD